MPEAANQPVTSSARRWLGPMLKWSLFALVFGFVVWWGAELWRAEQATLQTVEWNIGGLLLAGCAYAAGWLPSVRLKRKMMLRMGAELSFRDTARAYYCGHLGKYVPGKALVLIIRAALVKDRGSRAGPAALTAAYETLVMMATGAAVAVALSPLMLAQAELDSWPGWIRWLVVNPAADWLLKRPLIAPLVVISVTMAALPLISRLFSRAAIKMTPEAERDRGEPSQIDTRLLATGMLAFTASWGMHGLSLGLTIGSVSGNTLDLAQWAVYTGVVSAATVIGFAALFAPAGVGPREWILIEVLRIQPFVGPQTAIVAAVFLRIVWFLTEIGVAGILYYTVRPRLPAETDR